MQRSLPSLQFLPGNAVNVINPPEGGPRYRWYVKAQGISPDVIQADIQRYLGPNASYTSTFHPDVSFGAHPPNNNGANSCSNPQGDEVYLLASHRTLTEVKVFTHDLYLRSNS